MSQEVDERVVKLSFDNAKFEKNVDKSIKSLHALNDSLKLEGAEKGFAEVEKASEQMDFDKMQGAVDKLQEKFSALEVVGITAMVRITNKAIDTGEKLVKSLSIDQVTSGWSKYAQKTASVQTIMNATGKSITKVNHYLDKLMWYSDETSYGFTDMTASLGQLTAAGGDIDKLIPMIMGIANATAYAGKGASEFSRVIYNLNQSYSQGYLSLMDWKSVELAGVATAELKQQLIDTGVQLGKIKEGDVTIGTFGSTLSKKWADKEVMETAFGKLAEFTEAVKDLQESDPKKYSTAAKAIEALEDQYDEVTVKAFKAAQEAKSFTEAVDATKDAVSSGWMETFDILFGNYEEAKSFWSDLADEFWDIFAGGQDARNSWLKSAFDGGLDQLLDQTALGDVGDSFSEVLEKSLTDSGKLTAEDIENAGGLQKAMESAGITAQDLYDQIQTSLEVYTEAAKMSDKELAGYNVSRKTLEKTIAAYQDVADAIQNGTVNLEKYADQMGRMSGREHFFSGILNILEGIKSVLTPIREAFDDVFMTDGSPLYNLLKGFDELTSKFALSEATGKKVQKVFKGVFSVLSVGFKLIRTAGQIALAVIEALLGKLQPLTDLLLSVGAAFGDVFTELNERLNSAESVTDILDAVGNAIGRLLQPLKDIFGAIRALVTGSSIDEAGQKFGTFGRIVSTVNAIFQNFGLGAISLSGLIGKALRVLGGIFYLAFDGVKELIGKAFSGFQDAGKAVEDFRDNNLETLENVRDTVVSLPEKAGAAMKEFARTVQTSFYNVADACKTGIGAIRKFFNLEDGIDIYRLIALLDVGAIALAIWAVSKALNGMQKALKGVTDAAAKVLSNPVTDLLNSMKKAVDAWTAQHTTTNFVNVAKGISIAIGALSASIYMLSKIDDPLKAAQALGEVIAVLFSLVIAMKALAKANITGLDSAKIFATMISFSAGLLAFSASIKGIVQAMKMLKYFSKDQMNNAVGGLMAISFVMIAMAAAIAAANHFGNGKGIKGVSGFLVIATSLLEIAGVLYLLGNMDESKFQDAYGALFAMSMVMEGMVATIALANHFGGGTYGVSSFMAIAASLIVLAGACAAFAAVPDLDKGMTGVSAGLVELCGALLAFAAFSKNAQAMLEGAGAMILASAALLVLAKAIEAMSEAMAVDDSGAGFAGVTIGLIGLAAAIYLLSKNAMESVAAAAALVAMGAALILMAQAIKMLAEVQPFDIGKGLVALGISLLALVGAAAWLPEATVGILGVAGACLMLATALLLLTPAFKGLASLSIDQTIAGIAGMTAILAAVWALGANPAVAAGLSALSVNLIALAKAFNVFMGGVVKLAAAAAIFSAILLFAEPLCEVINSSADDIEEALKKLVDIVCDVINYSAEPITEALGTLFKAVVQALVDLIGWMWSGDGGEGGGIQGALEELAGNIGNGIVSAFKSIAGFIAKGLGLGMSDGTAQKAADTGAQSLVDRVKNFFKNAFGIHSPSKWMEWLGSFFAPGLTNGMTSSDSVSELQSGATSFVDNAKAGLSGALDTLNNWLFNRGSDAASSFYNGFGGTNIHSGSKEDMNKSFDSWYKKQLAPYGSNEKTLADLMGDYLAPISDLTTDTDPTTNSTGTGKSSKSGSSTKQKTAAELITEKYKTLLEKNKQLREQADNGYELWLAENENTASAEDLAAKRAENIQNDIDRQNERVNLAFQKYTELEKLGTQAESEARDAFNDYLEEKKSLAELKASQYTALYKEANEKLDTGADTLEKEYNLAAAKKERTSTKREQHDEETAYKKQKLETLKQKEKNAEKQYEYLKSEAGLAETDQRVVQARQDYLDAALERQQLENELADAQLEEIELAIDEADTRHKRVTAQLERLSKVYDDGDLSGRADAYKEAVETYGKDSEQARKAQLQGTTSSILGALTAVKNLNYQMQNTLDLEEKLSKAADKDKDSIRAEIEDSESAFLGFAENLAEAFNMDDSGKRAVLKLANTLTKKKNRDYMAEKLGALWNKATENNQQLKDAGDNMALIVGTAFSETGMEIGTECISTVVSLMQGDWANALASGLNVMLDVLSNEKVQEALASLFADIGGGLDELGFNFTNLAKLAKGSLGDEGMTGTLTQIGEAIGGSGGITEMLGSLGSVIGSIGSSVVGFISEFWPYILAALAIAGVLAGIAWLIKKHNESTGEEAEQAGIDYPTEYEKGIREGAPRVEQAVKDMTDTANSIALYAAQSIADAMDEDVDYEPTIRPVVDLTEVTEGADAVNDAFATEKAVNLDGSVSRKIAAAADSSPAIQNGIRSASDANLLGAIGALGDHMDAVGESIRGMKLVVDGRKAIGYVDSQLGARARRA